MPHAYVHASLVGPILQRGTEGRVDDAAPASSGSSCSPRDAVLPEPCALHVRSLLVALGLERRGPPRLELAVAFAGACKRLQSLLLSRLLSARLFDAARSCWSAIALKMTLFGRPSRGGDEAVSLAHAEDEHWDVVAQRALDSNTQVGDAPAITLLDIDAAEERAVSGSAAASGDAAIRGSDRSFAARHLTNLASPRGSHFWMVDGGLAMGEECVEGRVSLTHVSTLLGVRSMHRSFMDEHAAARRSSKLFCIGVDAEWRPDGRAERGRWPVSLLQLATSKSVFLVDLIALYALRREGNAAAGLSLDAAMQHFVSWLFRCHRGAVEGIDSSGEILTVGFGMATDLKRLFLSYPFWFSPLVLDRRKGVEDGDEIAAVRGDVTLSKAWAHDDCAGVLDIPFLFDACIAFMGTPDRCRCLGGPCPWWFSLSSLLGSSGSGSTLAGEDVVGVGIDASAATLAQTADEAEMSPGGGSDSPPGASSEVRETGQSSASPPSGRKAPKRKALPATTAGLSAFAEAILGRRLDKGQQISDWQERPLRRAQITYAALDACVLVALANRLFTCLLGGAHGDFATALEVFRSRAVAPWVEDDDDGAAGAAAAPPLDYSPTASAGLTSALPAVAPPESAPAATHPSAHAGSEGLSPLHVAAALAKVGLAPQEHLFWLPPRTSAAETAALLSVPTWRVAKSLAFFVADAPVLVIIRGDERVDARKLAEVCHCTSKNRVRLADADECVRLWGFRPGEFPAFGHREAFATYVDAGIEQRLREVAKSIEFNAAALLDASGSIFSEEASPTLCRDLAPDQVFAGGGALHATMRIRLSDIMRATRGTMADLALERGSSWGAAATCSVLPPPLAGSSLVGGPFSVLRYAKPRFIVDASLGRLLRWIRVAGFDAESTLDFGREYSSFRSGIPVEAKEAELPKPLSPPLPSSPPPPAADAASLRSSSGEARHKKLMSGLSKTSVKQIIAWANESGRIIVTKDTKFEVLQSGESCAIYHVSSNEGTPEQFREIALHFHLFVTSDDLMSRCAKCNGFGYNRQTVADVRDGEVCDRVKAEISEFWRCKKCEKLYWTGPKFDGPRKQYQDLFEKGP